MKNSNKPKIIVENPKKVLKTYSAMSLFANILIAVSGVGFTAFGAINQIDTKILFTAMAVCSALGLVGRFVKQEIQDAEEGPVGIKGISLRFIDYVKDKLAAFKDSILSHFK